MPKFEMEVLLPVDADQLSSDILNMKGVNYELFPFLKMSAPKKWVSKSISDWPVDKDLFSSAILLIGLLPIDIHHFKFHSTNSSGFNEFSSSLLNSQWVHVRTVTALDSGAKVSDTISYKSKVSILDNLFEPIYKAIFNHRHKRLREKYSAGS